MRDQLDNGAARRRVGIRPDGRAPARAQTTIMAETAPRPASITSGGFGPIVNGADRHGLRPERSCGGRHAADPDRARQADCPRPWCRCRSCPTATPLKGTPDGRQECDKRYTKDHEWVRPGRRHRHRRHHRPRAGAARRPGPRRTAGTGARRRRRRDLRRRRKRQGGLRRLSPRWPARWWRSTKRSSRTRPSSTATPRAKAGSSAWNSTTPTPFEALMDQDAYDEFLETL